MKVRSSHKHALWFYKKHRFLSYHRYPLEQDAKQRVEKELDKKLQIWLRENPEPPELEVYD